MARNSLGNSDELSVNFDVLYPPRNIRTEPGRIAEVKVPGGLRLECGADGYPPPTYQWLQKVLAKPGESGGGQEVYARGEGRTLTVDNATYEHEGLWACLAKNVIKGNITHDGQREWYPFYSTSNLVRKRKVRAVGDHFGGSIRKASIREQHGLKRMVSKGH